MGNNMNILSCRGAASATIVTPVINHRVNRIAIAKSKNTIIYLFAITALFNCFPAAEGKFKVKLCSLGLSIQCYFK